MKYHWGTEWTLERSGERYELTNIAAITRPIAVRKLTRGMFK